MYNARMTAQTRPTKKQIMKKLEEVIDPELYISIVDLGLVYNVAIKGTEVIVTMTLTTIGCPLMPIIEKTIQDKLTEIEGIETVHVNLVFDPPWDIEKMTEKGKATMGI